MADTLTITDNRTGKQYEIPIQDETIRAMDLRQIKASPKDFGLMTYDPALLNTAACRSRITFIDGDNGVLLYRGYPIEQLAEDSNYLETAYLILFGELPTAGQMKSWVHEITMHTMLHENIKKFMEGFQYDAHPMGIFLSTVGALSTFYPDAKEIFDERSRVRQTHRLIAKVPSIAAYAYRHSIGRPYVYPDNDLSFTGNFLNMLFKMTELKYQPNPVLEKALDVLFILHADHEQNCSTSAMRNVGSSQVDPYSALAAAAAALYGPLHGGANEAVLRMLEEIGTVKNVPDFIKRVKAGDGRLMGFGHRVYKSVRPARQGNQAHRGSGVHRHGPQPPARDRARARADRPAGRLLRDAQAVSERGLLFGADLSGHGLPARDVPGALCDSAHGRVDRTVGGNAPGPGAENRASAADLHRRESADVRAHGAAQGMSWLKAGVLALASASGLSAAVPQTQPPPGFDGGRAYEHVRQLVTIGPRPAGSAGLADARRYITDQLSALGIRPVEQAFDAATPLGTLRMVNLTATIQGARAERLVIAGHYDTKLFRQVRFVGANDGGSSAAFLLELARVLRARANPLTIELLFLDGEEAVVEWTGTDHTYGSRHYVEVARKSGTLASLRALILVDMIGERNLNIRREGHSTPWLTDLLWASAQRLKLSRYFLEETTLIEDDHVPFLQAGVPAVDLIDLDYAAWHTPNDTLDQISARSLQVVGDVLLEALPAIEAKLIGAGRSGR